MIKILIADDHTLIREGFKKLIAAAIGFRVVGEAENGFEALEFLRNNECDLLVLDISMPGKNGLELLKEIRTVRPDVKTLVLSMHPEDRFAIRALKAGAAGYLTKVSAPTELIRAIHKIVDGGKYVSASLAEKLAFNLDAGAKIADHEQLSDREYEVFRLIAEGKTVSEIAAALNLSQSTVNTYRSRILQKMNLRSNADIIHYALRNNLLD